MGTEHTHSQETTYMHTLLLLYFAQHTTLPPTIHILNYHTKLCTPTTNNIVFIFKAVYNYVYLFTRYLLPENTSKLYSSLHTKLNNNSNSSNNNSTSNSNRNGNGNENRNICNLKKG